jgi:hypothetical protein
MVILLSGRRRGDRRRRLVENAFLTGLYRRSRCSEASHHPKAISARRGSGKSPPYGFNIRPSHSAEHSLLNDHLRGDKPSKRSEGVPAFGLPLFPLSFLINSFLLQKIEWIKPCIFVREVRMKCFRRFFVRCRGPNGSTSLHAPRAVSLYFLKSARLSKKY